MTWVENKPGQLIAGIICVIEAAVKCKHVRAWRKCDQENGLHIVVPQDVLEKKIYLCLCQAYGADVFILSSFVQHVHVFERFYMVFTTFVRRKSQHNSRLLAICTHLSLYDKILR